MTAVHRSIVQPALLGVVAAAGTFGLLGTVSALWEKPLFVRMTPAGDLEMVLLALMSVLTGV